MLSTIIAAIIVMGFLMAAMAIGVFMGKEPIKGTCGGLSSMALGEDGSCQICGGKPQDCDNNEAADPSLNKSTHLAYDATTKN